jgi:mannitol/fructose-specific phosphotransferase system IIA component (Ntr-type)
MPKINKEKTWPLIFTKFMDQDKKTNMMLKYISSIVSIIINKDFCAKAKTKRDTKKTNITIKKKIVLSLDNIIKLD